MRAIVKYSRGFTLIEIIISIVAFGILMGLITAVFAPQVVHGTDPLYSMRATELGQSYLEEILSKQFADNSPYGNNPRCGESPPICTTPLGRDTGETTSHTTFDDVDDYDGFQDGSQTTAPTDQNGNARSNYTGFIVTASVSYAGTEAGLLNNTDAKRIIVTVTDPRGSQYVFAAYKTNF